MAQMEVITTVQRRRRWSRAEKERIVAASLEPGAMASEVARREGIHSSQLYRWRRQLCEPLPTASDFAAVMVTDAGSPSTGAPAAGLIEIELSTGTRVRITGAVDPGAVAATLKAVADADRRR